MTEPSKKEKRKQAEEQLEKAVEALKTEEAKLELAKKKQALVLEHYKPTEYALERAEMEFRKLDEFYELNKQEQALVYESENSKAKRHLEKLEETIKELKQIIKENRG